jgi:tetratricopeptide (TPR) repeat protein
LAFIPGVWVATFFVLALIDPVFFALGNWLFPFGQPAEGIILAVLVLGSAWAVYDEVQEIWLTRNVTLAEEWLRSARAEEPRARNAYARAQRRGKRRNEMHALYRLGGSLFTQERYEEAKQVYETRLSLAEELQDQEEQYTALDMLERTSDLQHDVAAERAFFERRLRLARDMADRRWLIETLENYASFAQRQGDLSLAESLHQENVTMTQAEGLTAFAPEALAKLGAFLVSGRGEREQGCAMMREAAAQSHGSGDRTEADIQDMMRDVGCEVED